MPTPERPTCGTCPYILKTIENEGFCYRFPPTVVATPVGLLPPQTFSRTDSLLSTNCDPALPWRSEKSPACGEHPDFPAYIRQLNE